MERLVLEVLAHESTALLAILLLRAVEKRGGFTFGDDDQAFWDALYHLEHDGSVRCNQPTIAAWLAGGPEPRLEEELTYVITATGRRRRAEASGLRVVE